MFYKQAGNYLPLPQGGVYPLTLLTPQHHPPCTGGVLTRISLIVSMLFSPTGGYCLNYYSGVYLETFVWNSRPESVTDSN